MPNNLFTLTLKGIICPVLDINDEEELSRMKHLFIVTEYVETDV